MADKDDKDDKDDKGTTITFVNGNDLVVEMVTKEDPMAARLLANKPDQYADYTAARFEELLAARFTTVEKLPLGSGTRLLYALEARR